MKRAFITTLTAVGLLTLPAALLFAADKEGNAAEAPAGKSVRLTIVTASGGGWGGARKVRAALEGQENVKNVILSGMRATVVMGEDRRLDEGAVKKAFSSKGLQFVSMDVVDRPPPVAVFNLQAKGVTWATTADKARVALEKMEGCSDAYVDPVTGITLLFSEKKQVDEKNIQEMLAPFKIKVSALKTVENLPY